MDLSTLMPQQLDIVKTLDRPLFVAAGAGSGKTFTLTRRIAYALSPESGPFVEHLDQILAITFTEDAASEIKDRVRRVLIDEGMGEEALAVDDAWISTIHGMCSRILRAHALELGIDPEFSILLDGDELMDRAVEHVLGRADNGLDEGLAAALEALEAWYPLDSGGGFNAGTSVRSLVRDMLDLSCQLPGGMDDMHALRGSIETGALADLYREASTASAGWKKTALPALDAIDAFEKSDKTFEDAVRLMMACGSGRACKAFPAEQVALLKAEAANTCINLLLACGGAAVDGLVALARAVDSEYRSLKADRGLLDTNDLLRMAYFALRDHPSIAKAYEGRFKMVMIDEFQDTDQMQVELISRLAGAHGEALCTVGDAQQSIYRFRGADVEVFRRQEHRFDVDDSAGSDGAPARTKVNLVRNFRSHDEILRYVSRVFDGANGGLMKGFLDLEACEGRKDKLAAPASRRQAIMVAGGTGDVRAQAKARAIAERFRALADGGQPQGDMVLLLGKMKHAGIYARAMRDQGLDCVIAGGSVFATTPEVKTIHALVCTLANPADTAQGLMPLLASPLFALGAQEFLALSTRLDETGGTLRRNIDAGILSDEDVPGLCGLPLLERARTVLRRAFWRVGRDPFAQVARDVVNESGWMERLAKRGPEGKAVAANVLKALDMVAEKEGELGNMPRKISLGFDQLLAGKDAPGALNESGTGAVRILTVHSSKGLEYPVVAVADCFDARGEKGRVAMGRCADGAQVVALPERFKGLRLDDGSYATSEKIKTKFDKYFGKGAWLDPALLDDVCETGSPAEAFTRMREEGLAAELEERARLLYVAMTRARELLILVMDGAPDPRAKVPALKFDESKDLTGRVLDRILPTDGSGHAVLDSDRLVFDGSRAGDYEFIALKDVVYGEKAYDANTMIDGEGRLVRLGASAMGTALATGSAEPAPGPADDVPDHFELVRSAAVGVRVGIAPREGRDSYSYSSIAAELHAEAEDRGEVPAAGAGSDAGTVGDGIGDPKPAFDSTRGDPTALGTAFHAACQWLIETGSDAVPVARADALARYWGLTQCQRARMETALTRWCGSAVRRELLSWPRVMAEVPFFSLGSADEDLARFGAYAEGAIDALGMDPADPSRALVIDYKTGGSADETPEELQEKHTLQARVYADVLHRAGYKHVDLVFVRVEQADPANPGEPQLVRYSL